MINFCSLGNFRIDNWYYDYKGTFENTETTMYTVENKTVRTEVYVLLCIEQHFRT